jgi:hypothetical protein
MRCRGAAVLMAWHWWRSRAATRRAAAGKPFVCFEHNNEADLSGVPSIDNPVYV